MTTFESKTGRYQLRSVTYQVQSNSNPAKFYDVSVDDNGWHCPCPDATYRRRECKHIRAARQGNVASKPRIRVMPLPSVAARLAAVSAMYA